MRRKVLIIDENAPVPFDPRVWNEARSLQQNGYDVSVICPVGKGNSSRFHEVIEDIHIYRHPMPKEGGAAITYLWEYACALFWEFIYACWIYLRHGFQVIQGCNPPDDIFLVALPFKLFGVKYIFDHHDVNPELYLAKYGKKGLLYKIQVGLEQLTYKSSSVVMATNLSYRELAITRGGVDSADVFVVRNGPNLATFRPVPPNDALKHGKRFLVGYVGNMGSQDGLDILLDVARHIKDLGRRDVHFTCVGGGSILRALRQMVQDKDIADIVNFTGRVPDAELLEVLSTADVCVNPDRPCEMNDKSTMIKIMEYMALAKPIVQFDMKEGRFSAGEASLYASNDNQIADFAAKLLWLLDNPNERKRMGKFGRKRVEEALAWDYSVPNLLAAYERCFNKRANRWPWLRSNQSRNCLKTGNEMTSGDCKDGASLTPAAMRDQDALICRDKICWTFRSQRHAGSPMKSLQPTTGPLRRTITKLSGGMPFSIAGSHVLGYYFESAVDFNIDLTHSIRYGIFCF